MSVIEIRNLDKNFGNLKAVSDLSLSAEAGEILGFVGKNGAGKSTTLRCIVDILRPSAGSITILGMPSKTRAKQIKEKMSYVPSEAIFYDNISVEQILKFACKIANVAYETALDLCKYFELDPTKKIGDLSLGNRKKVSLVQGFLKQSQVMVFDEPTSGLDPLMQEKFFQLITKAKNRGACIFLSSHNLSEIEQYCDRVAIIKSGKLLDVVDLRKAVAKNKRLVMCTLANGEKLNFEFDEDANKLIEKLSHLNLKDVEIKRISVYDEFIQYYQDFEGAPNAVHAPLNAQDVSYKIGYDND